MRRQRRGSIEGWDWFKTPPKPKGTTASQSQRLAAMDLIDRDALTPFSSLEQIQIRRWRAFGRPDVSSHQELDAFISLVHDYHEWHPTILKTETSTQKPLRWNRQQRRYSSHGERP